MRSLLLFSCLFLAPEAILNGHIEGWPKYGHLVKILSRASNESRPLACSGTLISPRLVLTATDCLMEEGKQVTEVMVFVGRSKKPALRKRASVAELNGTIAYLKLTHPIPPAEICPGDAELRVARLSIVPSLTRASVTPFDWAKIDATTCRIIGFESQTTVEAFTTTGSVGHAVAKVEVEETALTVRRINTADPAPCFEDTGAPFECLVGAEFIQVGVFTSLFAVDDGKEHRFKRDETAVKADNNTTTTTTAPEAKNEPKEEDDEKTDTTTTTTTPEPTNAPNEEEKIAATTQEPTNAPKPVKEDVFARCLLASSIRFARIEAASVAEAIERYDHSAFVEMHEQCRIGAH